MATWNYVGPEDARIGERRVSPSGSFVMPDLFAMDANDNDEQNSYYQDRTAYHMDTRMMDGRPVLLIDPGSVGNLCGEDWAKSVAEAAAQNGFRPEYRRRDKPLSVRGVGSGSQLCTNDCFLPVAFKTADGRKLVKGNFTTPCVQQSHLPGLMGLKALRDNRAVIDIGKLEMYFSGPQTTSLRQRCHQAPTARNLI